MRIAESVIDDAALLLAEGYRWRQIGEQLGYPGDSLRVKYRYRTSGRSYSKDLKRKETKENNISIKYNAILYTQFLSYEVAS